MQLQTCGEEVSEIEVNLMVLGVQRQKVIEGVLVISDGGTYLMVLFLNLKI